MEINFDIKIRLGYWNRAVGWRLGSVYRYDSSTHLLQANPRSKHEYDWPIVGSTAFDAHGIRICFLAIWRLFADQRTDDTHKRSEACRYILPYR